VSLDWRRDAFTALATSIHPRAKGYRDYFHIQAQPGGLTSGDLLFGPILLYFTVPLGTTEVNAGAMAFGDPFPASFGLFATAESDYSVDYQVPGGGTFTAYAYLVSEVDVASLASPVAPLVGPVMAPRIDGQDVFTDQMIADAPTLSWSAPAVGAATDYAVFVYHLVVRNGQAASQPAFSIRTTGTTVAIPPDLLSSGESYYFAIVSRWIPGVDVTQAPERLSFPYGFATALTGVLTAK
jgi:hypothetical protein